MHRWISIEIGQKLQNNVIVYYLIVDESELFKYENIESVERIHQSVRIGTKNSKTLNAKINNLDIAHFINAPLSQGNLILNETDSEIQWKIYLVFRPIKMPTEIQQVLRISDKLDTQRINSIL